MKFNNYVALEIEGKIKYVTSVNNQTKIARWDSKEKAMRMPENNAKNIVFGLVCNGRTAFVVKMPSCFEPQND